MYALVIITLLAGAISAPTNPVHLTSFDQLDADHDGYVTEDDFIKAYKIFDDGDGHMKLPEFTTSFNLPFNRVLPAFKIFDGDNDGDITLSDVHTVFTSFDGDNDEKVTSTEFTIRSAGIMLETTLGE